MPKTETPQEVQWEVLPPEEQAKKSQLEPLFRWLAQIMDEFLRVPGTRFPDYGSHMIAGYPGRPSAAGRFATASAARGV